MLLIRKNLFGGRSISIISVTSNQLHMRKRCLYPPAIKTNLDHVTNISYSFRVDIENFLTMLLWNTPICYSICYPGVCSFSRFFLQSVQIMKRCLFHLTIQKHSNHAKSNTQCCTLGLNLHAYFIILHELKEIS